MARAAWAASRSTTTATLAALRSSARKTRSLTTDGHPTDRASKMDSPKFSASDRRTKTSAAEKAASRSAAFDPAGDVDAFA